MSALLPPKAPPMHKYIGRQGITTCWLPCATNQPGQPWSIIPRTDKCANRRRNLETLGDKAVVEVLKDRRGQAVHLAQHL